MTFRPSTRERLIYPIALFMLTVFVYFALRFLRDWQQIVSLILTLVILCTFIVLVIKRSFHVWTSRVVVDQTGVHWEGGPLRSGSLDWAYIKAVTYDERPSTMTPGSIEDTMGLRYPLPFLNDELLHEIEGHLPRR